MLTPEERQRIEDEESRRIAEEHYREEVRARLQGKLKPSEENTPSSNKWIIVIAIALVGIICLVVLANQYNKPSNSGNKEDAATTTPLPIPKTRYIPITQKIASGQITVRAGGEIPYRVTITPDMVDPVVTGNFTAYGGSGNDIQAVFADQMNYTNWSNGHQAQVLWGTQGKQTTGNIEVKFIQPGEYYLAFSNRFSVFTDKQVSLEVELNYKKAETYY